MARQDGDLKALLPRFVCVRLTQMRGVDLSLFQFDYDMTWAGFFLNADGTVYGRYGSRTSGKKGADSLMSIPGLRKAMERALDLHAKYPGNRESLAGKRGAAPKWTVPETMPALVGKFDRPGEAGCIHCHHVYNGLRRSLSMAKEPIPDRLLWTYPLPDVLGIRMDIDEGNRVVSVSPGSAAHKAGVEANDVIASASAQAILSLADLQWALQSAPDRGTLPLEIVRGGAPKRLALTLDGSWRQGDLSWRESMWDARPGLWLVDLTPDERAKAGIPAGALGLRIKWAIPRGLAKKAGFLDGDLLVEFDGKTDPLTESQLIVRVRQNYPSGSKIPVGLLRGGKRLKLDLEVD